MKSRLGVALDRGFFRHAIARHSPENPERLRGLYDRVEQMFSGRCDFVAGRELMNEDLYSVHSSLYLDQLREHELRPDPYSYDKDTYLMEQSLDVARRAAGSCLELADRIMQGELDAGFSLVRPPGHHAEAGRGAGFCILNNVAITARYLQRVYGLRRILIVDFDAHHGNGTQDIFYERPEVLFLSIHQHNIFPFTGKSEELGSGEGRGYTINVPVYPLFGDEEYTCLLGTLLQIVVEQYLPQIILVSAGYDGHQEEAISGLRLSTDWFHLAGRMLRQYAREVCDGRILFILEGGYNPRSLERSVLATLQGMMEYNGSRVGVLRNERAHSLIVEHPFSQYWAVGG